MLSHKREGIFACRPGTEPAVEEPVGGMGGGAYGTADEPRGDDSVEPDADDAPGEEQARGGGEEHEGYVEADAEVGEGLAQDGAEGGDDRVPGVEDEVGFRHGVHADAGGDIGEQKARKLRRKSVRTRREEPVEEVDGEAGEERHGDLQEERRREGPQEQGLGDDEDGVEQDIRHAEGDAEDVGPGVGGGADGGHAQPRAGAEHDARGHDVHTRRVQRDAPHGAAGEGGAPHSRRTRP